MCRLTFTHGLLEQQCQRNTSGKRKKSPEDHPGRDVPGASREDRLRELQPLPRDRAAAAGQLDTPDGGPGSKPGETVIVAPLPRSATSASATLLAGADGWS